MLSLEGDLVDFVETASETLAADAVNRTLSRLRDRVEAMILTERMRHAKNSEDRESYLASLTALSQEWQAQLANGAVSAMAEDMARSLEELIFHAGERIRLRYRELFRGAFHPGRFRIGKPSDKLREASDELLETVDRQVDIEIRTFALRAESHAKHVVQDLVDRCNQQLAKVGIAGIDAESALGDAKIVPEAVHTSVSRDVLNPYFRHFSSPKQFFEGLGAETMMAESEQAVMAAAKANLGRVAGRVLEDAKTVLAASLQALYRDAVQRVAEAIRRAQEPAKENALDDLIRLKAYLDQKMLSV